MNIHNPQLRYRILAATLAVVLTVSLWYGLPVVLAQSVPASPSLGVSVQNQVIVDSIGKISLSASLFGSDNRMVTNGEYDVHFAIYSKNREVMDPYPSNSDQGSRLWEETQTVTMRNGIFRAFLGAKTPFPASLNFENADYFIGIRIGTDSEMIPRKRLGAVPSAINSQLLEGHPVGTGASMIPLLGKKGSLTLKGGLTAAGNLIIKGKKNDIAGVLNLSGNALTSTGLLLITPGSGLTVDSAGQPVIINSSTFDLNNTGAITIGISGNTQDITFETANFDVNSTGAVTIDGTDFTYTPTGTYQVSPGSTYTVSATGAISIDSDASSTLSGAGVNLTSDGANAITLTYAATGGTFQLTDGTTRLEVADNGDLVLGDDGATTTIDGSTITLSGNTVFVGTITQTLTDAVTNALDIQEGTNNYININTTDGAEAIQFGNAVTNPIYSFLGTGLTSFGGNIDMQNNLILNIGNAGTDFTATGGLNLAGDLDVNGTVNDIAGTLNLSGGALTSTGAMTITPAAGNNLNVTLSGTGDFAVNTNQLYVDTSTGYVGIGTTTPGSALDVKGTLRLSGSTSGYVGLAPATNAGSITYTLPSADGGNGQVLATNGGATLSWSPVNWTASGNDIYNNNSGNVGIGDISPDALLDIDSSATATSVFGITNTGIFTGTGANSIVQITANSAASGTILNISGNGLTTGTAINIPHTTSVIASGGSLLRLSSTSADTSTTTGTLFDLSSTTSTAGTQVLQTYSGLTTGVGESIVTDSLTAGNALSIASSATAFTGTLQLITLSGSNASNTGSLLELDNIGTSNANTSFYIKHYATGTNNLAFRIDDVSGDTTPFVVDGMGYVGIGTTGPAAALDVTSPATSGGLTTLVLNPGAHTAMTAEKSDFSIATHTDTITGAIATQRFSLFNTPTITAGSALAVTNADTVNIAGIPAAAGSATISGASALRIPVAPQASANVGLVSLGSGPWDGATAGYFGTSASSNASGTILAANAASGYAGDLANFEVAGVSKFKVDASGNVTYAGTTTVSGNIDMQNNIITNIGNAGTDFVATTGALNLAGTLTLAANANLTMLSGTGLYSQTYSGTATPITLTADSMTTGTGISISADALSSGSGIAIDSTSTALAGKLLNLTASGAANATTRYGVYSSLTGAGTTSTNVAGYFNAQNGTTANYGLIVENGNVGIGTTSPSSMLSLFGATNAMRLSYDATNYSTLSANSTGELQIKGASVYDASLTIGSNDANSTAIIFDNLTNDFYVGIDNEDSSKFKIGLLNQDAFMTITSTGNVGIGTTSPGYKLEVNGTTNIVGALTITGSILPNTDDTYNLGDDTHRFANLFLGPETLHIGTSTADEGSLSYTTSSNVFNMQSTGNIALQPTSGNVGIGTTSPSSMLSLFGATNAMRLSYDATNYSTLSANSTGELQIKGASVYDASLTIGSNDANSTAIIFDNLTNDFYVGIDNEDSSKFKIGLNIQDAFMTIVPTNGYMGIGTVNPLSKLAVSGGMAVGSGYAGVSAAPTDGLIIQGNLGIGTTNPLEKLDIRGSTTAGTTLFGIGTDANGITLLVNSAGTNGGTFIASGAAVQGVLTVGASVSGATQYSIVARGGAILAADTGNVGIGTVSPEQKLTMNGDAHIYNTTTLGSNLVDAWTNNGTNPYETFTAGTPTSDVASAINTTGFGIFYKGITITAGRRYKATFTLTLNSGSTPVFGSFTGVNLQGGQYSLRTSAGANSIEWTSTRSGTEYITFYAPNGEASDFSITGFSLQEVTGGNLNLAGILTGGGSTGLKVLANGNVGIGTTNPGSRLQVTAASGATDVSYFTTNDYVAGSTGTRLVLGYGAASGNTYSSIRSEYTGGQSSSNLILNPNSGNVGIGTTNPLAKLEVINSQRLSFDGSPSDYYLNWAQQDNGANNVSWNLTQWNYNSLYNVISIKNGNVGIGTTGPLTKLDVFTTAVGAPSYANAAITMRSVGGAGLYFGMNDSVEPYPMWLQTSVIGSDATQYPLALNPLGGNVGIGTTNPGYLLQVQNTSGGNAYAALTATPGGYNSRLYFGDTGNVTGQSIGSNTLYNWLDFYSNSTEKMRLSSTGGLSLGNSYVATDPGAGNMIISGNVGIGTTNPGYILDVQHASSKINSKNGYLTNGADYAEYFSTNNTDLKSGEVVCVDTAQANSVKRCERSGDNNVMGVVSTNPSIVGNGNGTQRDNDPHYKIIGMIGQVPGLVSNENGDIQIGDSLTASVIPGYMRKANAGESTVGVALQDFRESTGTIQILISRRNQSLTVEKVEEAVTQNIASMNIQDQVDRLVANAKTALDIQIANQADAFNTLVARTNFIANAATSTVMTVDIMGNVGIGVTNPGSALDVNGAVSAYGFTVPVTQDIALTMPADTLSADSKSVDLFKLVAYNLSGVRELSAKVDINTAQIESVNLKTDQNITTVAGLQVSVDSQLLIASNKIDALTATDVAEDASILALVNAQRVQGATLTDLQASLAAQASLSASLQAQITALMDFYSVFQLGNIITKDIDGNVDLLGGNLQATKITAIDGFAIDTSHSAAPTLGTAILYPVAVDADNDGNDDITGDPMTDPDVVARDGKNIVIQTSAVASGSRIFVTPKTALAESLAVTGKNNGVDFIVSLKNTTLEPISFDWLIVEEK